MPAAQCSEGPLLGLRGWAKPLGPRVPRCPAGESDSSQDVWASGGLSVVFGGFALDPFVSSLGGVDHRE